MEGMTEEEKTAFISKRRAAKDRENTGAREAGSTLAGVRPTRTGSGTAVCHKWCFKTFFACVPLQLARQLQAEVPSDEVVDGRENDKLPLDIRMQGAMAMLAKTRCESYCTGSS
jgi:hypothetical protein